LFCISVSFFFLSFSTLWVISSLILSMFILNSFISLFMVFSVSFGVYLGLLWFHLFIFVFSHILFCCCLGISWVPLYVLVDHV
jgi:hypothetical protein